MNANQNPANKTPGQAAYEADCEQTPHYQDGKPRAKWDALSEIARWSWERNPTARNTPVPRP